MKLTDLEKLYVLIILESKYETFKKIEIIKPIAIKISQTYRMVIELVNRGKQVNG
jgi:hypothetical protein